MLVAHVLYADRFGNLVLDAERRLEGRGRASCLGGKMHPRAAAATFADGDGGLVVYRRLVRAAWPSRSTAAAPRTSWALGRDDELRIEPA